MTSAQTVREGVGETLKVKQEGKDGDGEREEGGREVDKSKCCNQTLSKPRSSRFVRREIVLHL